MHSPSIYLTFHRGILELVRRSNNDAAVTYTLNRRASIKDIIEALGVPHTEVGQIILNSSELTFHFIPQGEESIDIFPFTGEIPITIPTVLRPEPFSTGLKFMVDINALKLARNLRMIGIDASIVPGMELTDIAENAVRQQRILVTRNRDLLKLNSVTFGHLLRSEDHERQLHEVFKRYNLGPHTKPFSRCLTCNHLLKPVAKEDILGQLEPLTIKYYQEFKQCSGCKKIYWQGSHYNRMRELLKSFV